MSGHYYLVKYLLFLEENLLDSSQFYSIRNLHADEGQEEELEDRGEPDLYYRQERHEGGIRPASGRQGVEFNTHGDEKSRKEKQGGSPPCWRLEP